MNIDEVIEACARTAWIDLFQDSRPVEDDVQTIIRAFLPIRDRFLDKGVLP